MKAIRVWGFGDPGVMKLEEAAEPVAAEGEVLIRVHAIGVNPVDTYIRAGIYGKREFPYTPGMDASGVVEAIGAGVEGLRAGDRVYTSGTVSGAYAELVVAKGWQAHLLPEGISFEEGAALGVPYGTAYYGLIYRGRAKAGERVLVHGATGGVGIAAVQMARAYGMRVIGTGGTEKGRRLVMEQGAHHVLDHGAEGYLGELMSLTGNRGVDVILEMLANVNLGKDLGVLSPGGRVVVIGSRGRIEIDPRETMRRNADICGMTLMNAREWEVGAIHAAIFAGLENGTLRPVVGRRLPLSMAGEAHDEVMKSGSYGKIVLIP